MRSHAGLRSYAGQVLDIEVDQVAGMLVFIANHRRRRIERTKPVHARSGAGCG